MAERVPTWVGEGEWRLLRGNIAHLRELDEWRDVLDGDVATPVLELDDRTFVDRAAAIAGAVDWAAAPWTELASRLKLDSGRKGKALFHPLRLALTGRDSGPEMAPLLARIGRERAINRLRAASS